MRRPNKRTVIVVATLLLLAAAWLAARTTPPEPHHPRPTGAVFLLPKMRYGKNGSHSSTEAAMASLVQNSADANPALWAEPRYRGLICQSTVRGYAFIAGNTVEHVAGPEISFTPALDLFVHVRQNPVLGDPIPANLWIQFYLRRDDRQKSGVEVYGAEPEHHPRRA